MRGDVSRRRPAASVRNRPAVSQARRSRLESPEEPERWPEAYSLNLLGSFSFLHQSRALPALPKKAQGMLAYLAMKSGQPVPREQLATLLWSRSGDELARRSLRQCLISVRASLGADAHALLTTDADNVLLESTDGLAVDVQRFESLSSSTELDGLEAASKLYRGDLLAGLQIASGPFADWMLMERQRLSAKMSDVLFRLAGAHAQNQDVEDAIAAAQRLTMLDPLREDGHRLLIQLLAAAGKRSAALKQYAACVDLLRRDLGIAPERATTELAEAIRKGDAVGAAIAAPAAVVMPAHSEKSGNAPPVTLQNSASPLALPDKPSIAVLSFRNLSDDPDQDYFADGIVEDITVALGRVPWLFVIASSSAFSYRAHAADVRQIGAELGVRYVLRGSVRKGGRRLRIVVQLTDTSDGRHVWSERFEGELDDIFVIQDRVTNQVSAMVAPAMQSVEIERARRKATENLSAYDLYLQALRRFRTSHADNEEAVRLLYKAIELDPRYALAYGLAARCYHLQTVFGWALPSDERMKEGFRLAYVAAELGRHDSEALWMAGHNLAQVAGDIDYGLGLIDRSLTINPNSASAWISSCFIRSHLGDTETALEHFAQAQRLNPLDSMHHVQWHAAALAHFVAGRCDESSLADDRALKERPTYPPPLRLKLVTSALLGRTDQAHEYLRRLLVVNPDATVTRLEALWAPAMQRQPQTLARYLHGLRLAGLPE